MSRKTSRPPENPGLLLPWYLNGNLSPVERRRLRQWLTEDPTAGAELAAWRQVQSAVMSQPEAVPAAAIRQQLMIRVQSSLEPNHQPSRLRPALLGLAVALGIFLLLWGTIRPGLMLQWSVHSEPLAAFRIYRAPVGSADFGLVGEVPARAQTKAYRYVDTALVPGRTYVYRVEALGPGGQSAISQVVTANGWQALPGQMTTLLISLIAGGMALALDHYRRHGRSPRPGLHSVVT